MPDAAWAAELDAAVDWLDRLPLAGRIVELRAGIGFWSVLLATRGELTAIDERPGMLEAARARLVAHRLRAHLHPRRLLDEAEGAADAVVLPFVLGSLGPTERPAALERALSWLAPGGRLVVIDVAAAAGDLAVALGGRLSSVEARMAGREIVLATALTR